MKGDMVTLNASQIEQFRRDHAFGRVELCEKLGIHFVTGQKVLNGEPIALAVAKRIAAAMGVTARQLIKSWTDDTSSVRRKNIVGS